MAPLVFLFILGVVAAVPVKKNEECGYKNCPQYDPDVLNVHIVAHTHDDVGWLKTVDQYYYGSKNNIQKAGVQYILDSVVKELWEDPKRKFIYVETAFFWKWWVRQSAETQQKVHTLVDEGRLQFVGGAWSMNDEAAVHYQSTVDQFTWGLSKINQTFGPCALPRVGWQIDPFGHSREFASLLAGMGYDGLFLGRIDYQDKQARLRDKRMEMVWRGDDDLGSSSDIFTGILFNTYSPPPGFCFDVLCNDEPIIDDPDSPLFNVDDKIEVFLNYVNNQARSYRTNNVVITMGGDFTYQDAAMWYMNLDKLIEFKQDQTHCHDEGAIQSDFFLVKIDQGDMILVWARFVPPCCVKNTFRPSDILNNKIFMTERRLTFSYRYSNLKAAKDGLNVKLYYSTPNCYLKAVKEANPTLPTKRDDFFPYASDPNAYWTGYFTSRPTTKYFERQGNNYLQGAKQLQILAGLEHHNEFVLNELKSAMGVMQHHDAITGTEKQHVTHDYERLLDQAIEDSLLIPRQAFNKIMQGDSTKPPVFTFDRCRLNESSCYASENHDKIVVTLYNPVAWSVNESVRIPVVEGNYDVYAPNGEKIDSQIVEIPQPIQDIPTRVSKATHEVVFIAHLHPLMIKSFYIQKIARTKRNIPYKFESKNVQYTNDFDGFYEHDNINEYIEPLKLLLPPENFETFAFDYKNRNTLGRNVELGSDVNMGSDRLGELRNYGIGRDNIQMRGSHRSIELRRNIGDKSKDNRVLESFSDCEKCFRENRGSEQSGSDRKIDVIGEGRSNDNLGSNVEGSDKSGSSNMGRDYKGELRKEKTYPEFNDEEMRMLSDEPAVVERLDDYFVIENDKIKLHIDNTSGAIKSISNGENTINLTAQFYYYPGCVGNNEIAINRSSGAYIFRPNATTPISLSQEDFKVVNGKVVKEIHMKWSNNVFSSVKLYDKADFIELDFVVGPIDITDGIGKEFIVKYETDLITNGEVYTDSNGRQILLRQMNKRPQYNVTLAEPIAGNYYPITNQIYIQNDENRLTILTDRSEGGSSLVEGEIELMLHRRLLHDDAFGVGEALNETAKDKGLVVRGTHRIMLSSSKDNRRKEAEKVLELHLRPLIFVSGTKIDLAEFLKLNNMNSFLKQEMPKGIHLLTLEPWGEKLLLRLENYLTKNDGSSLQVDLTTILKNINVKAYKETTLSANEGRNKWSWKTEGAFDDVLTDTQADDGFKVNIKPKQIRTFILDYEFVA